MKSGPASVKPGQIAHRGEFSMWAAPLSRSQNDVLSGSVQRGLIGTLTRLI
jgi:hypothetical protein